MFGLIPSIVVLGLAASAAIRLTQCRLSPAEFAMERVIASQLLALATVVQSAHFAEERATDFHVRFPALFGLEPMPLPFFVVFNVAWIAIWIALVPLLRSAKQPRFSQLGSSLSPECLTAWPIH
jgi:hypothetical protein